MCTQVSSPVIKLEITRLLQPLYVFKSSRAHLRHCVFCSSVSKWGTHLAQTFLRFKRFFFSELFAHCLLICQYNQLYLWQSRILFDHNLYSSDVSLGNRSFRPSRMGTIYNRKFLSCKSLNPPKTWTHWNGLRSIYTTQFINVCFESIFSLMRHLIKLRISVFWSIQVNWSVYMTASISVWNISVSWKAICTIWTGIVSYWTHHSSAVKHFKIYMG